MGHVNILEQFQVRAPFKIPDLGFVTIEDREKFFDPGFFKMHADNSDEHVDSIFMLATKTGGLDKADDRLCDHSSKITFTVPP